MGEFQESTEVDDIIDKLLIDYVKEHPSLYYTDTFSELDEKYWDEIQHNTGIQKSWLKKRWKTVRNEHRRIIIFNHIHKNKVPLHAMASHLNFLIIDLNGANQIDFEDLTQPKTDSFHISKEMLEDCDIDESVTLDSIKIPKVIDKKNANETESESEISAKITKTHSECPPEVHDEHREILMTVNNISNNPSTDTKSVTQAKMAVSNADERCEDTIFGELVVAMLKKMSPDQKKQAKKDIMNILL